MSNGFLRGGGEEWFISLQGSRLWICIVGAGLDGGGLYLSVNRAQYVQTDVKEGSTGSV